jgi:predicted permease
MSLFLDLGIKLFPIYVIIFLGYFSGKIFKLDINAFSKVLIYFILPYVIFNGILNLDLEFSYLALPVLFYFICTGIALFGLYISGLFYEKKDPNRNIIAFGGGYGNYGFYAIPTAIAVFGKEIEPLLIFITIGFQLFQDTIGFFILSKGNFTTRQSIIKVLKLPGVYAFTLGFLLNIFELNSFAQSQVMLDLADIFRNSLIFLGMFVTGLAASKVPKFRFNLKFISLIFLLKFVIWPVLVLGFIFLDKSTLALFNDQIYTLALLLSLIPIAGLVPSFAQEAGLDPSQSSVAVFISNFISLILIPLAIVLF